MKASNSMQNENKEIIENLSKNLEYISRKKITLKSILQLYQYLGLVVAFIGMIYLLIIRIKTFINHDFLIGILLIGIGFFISLFSFVYLELKKQADVIRSRSREIVDANINFILTWMAFEKTLDSSQTNIKNKNKYSYYDHINNIYFNNIIDESEFYYLKKAIEVRNKIIHDTEISPEEEVKKLNEILIIIIKKILNQNMK